MISVDTMWLSISPSWSCVMIKCLCDTVSGLNIYPVLFICAVILSEENSVM